jgi:hypothetical protein
MISGNCQELTSNLPIVYINTHNAFIVDEPRINAEMGIIYNGEGVLNRSTDRFNNFDGNIGIEIRGSSSQMFPKKQYGFSLVDSAGNEKDTTLLGLPEESDWILFAPYNDKSLLRDVLAYKMGNDLGRYAPRTRYCELLINGGYEGVYVLIEKIKRDKNRVNINKLEPDEVSGDEITGGYIIKIDKLTGNNSSEPGWTSAFQASNGSAINFLYDYPDADKISPEQKAYIQDFIFDFEHALSGAHAEDAVDGYAKYIDVDSFVDFFIMNEVTKNVDGYRLSTYMHKQRNSDGGKLVMGPIWDFNLGFGNADYCTSGTPNGFVLDFNSICPNDFWLIPFWWKRLLQDPRFARKVANRWSELRESKFKTESIHHYIDSTVSVLNNAAERNFNRWLVLDRYVWPNYYVGSTYDSEVSWLKTWIEDRMFWLDNAIGGLTTAVEENMKAIAIEPIPNPFKGSLEFRYTVNQPGHLQLDFYNASGMVMESMAVQHSSSGKYSCQIGNGLSSGLYYCILRFNGVQYRALKLIKQ